MVVKLSDIIIVVAGIILRFAVKWLVGVNGLSAITFSSLDSWGSLLEAISLSSDSISPYDSDIVHQPPISIYIWSFIHQVLHDNSSCILLVLEVYMFYLLAILSEQTALYLLQCQTRDVSTYNTSAVPHLLQAQHLHRMKTVTLLVYALNPYSVLAFTSQSTAAVSNILVLKTMIALTKGQVKYASIMIAISTYLSLHPVVFMLAVMASVHKSPKMMLECCVIYSGVLMGLLFGSFIVEGNWNFVDTVYKHIFLIVDCTPHFSVYWYFAAEMFDHFREFFLISFNLLILVTACALTLRLYEDFHYLSLALWLLLVCLRPYPSIGELGALLSTLPTWSHLFKYSRMGMIPFVQLFVTIFIALIMHYLWIFCGVANSNFYFGASMNHALATIFMFSDLLGSYFKREFILRYGPEPTLSDGSKIVMSVG